MRLCPLLAAALLAAPICAQEARDPLALIPKDALFVGWIDGPAALKQAFGETRLAALAQGPELEAMCAPLLEQWRAHLAAAPPEARQLLETAEKALQDYAGRIWCAFEADLAAGTAEGDFDPVAGDLRVTVVFAGDESTDFEALARTIADAAERDSADELRDVRVAGQTYRVMQGEEGGMTLPFVRDGHLVIVGAADLERALDLPPEQSFAERAGTLPQGAAGLWVDATRFWEAVRARAEEEQPEIGAVLEAFGLSALEAFAVSVAAAEEHVMLRSEVRLGAGPRGIFGVFAPVDGPPPILELAPVQRATWSVTAVDWAQLYGVIKTIFAAVEEEVGMTWADVEAQFEEMFRARLHEDLIAQLGTGVLTVGPSPVAPGDEKPGVAAGIEGVCYAFALKDAPRFEESLEKVLRSRGLHVARKAEEYRGFEVYRLPIGGMLELHYAITSRLLLIGIGGAGGRELRAVLDEERARSEGEPRAAFPPEVEARLDLALDGWQSVGVQSVAALIDTVGGGVGEGLRASQAPPQVVAGIEQALQTVRRLLAQYDLTTWVSVTRATRDRLELQVVW